MNWSKHWRLGKHKSLEMQFDWLTWPIGSRLNSWLFFEIDIRTECDHAGATFAFTLLRLVHFGMDFYDNRHWDDENEDWEKYDEE